MSKLSFQLLVILGLFAIVFTSCTEDDEIAFSDPEITLTVADTAITSYFGTVGDELDITVDVSDPDGLSEVIIRRYVDGIEDTDFTDEYPLTTNPENFSEVVVYTLQDEDALDDVELEVQALDVNGNSSTAIILIEATVDPTYSFSTVLLFAPLADFSSETFFSVDNGNTYSVNDIVNTTEAVSDSIDFGYFYGQDFNATLSSPVSYPIDYSQSGWFVENETLLRKTDLTSSEFLEFENDVNYLITAFDEGTEGSDPQEVRNLEEGEVIAFQLDQEKGGRVGLILINSIEAGTGENAYIDVDVIVERPE